MEAAGGWERIQRNVRGEEVLVRLLGTRCPDREELGARARGKRESGERERREREQKCTVLVRTPVTCPTVHMHK